MKKEKTLRYTGDKKNEAFMALELTKDFITRKPEKDYFRHLYIGIHDANEVDHIVSDGGRINEDLDLDDLYEKASKMLSEVGKINSFYISATISTE